MGNTYCLWVEGSEDPRMNGMYRPESDLLFSKLEYDKNTGLRTGRTFNIESKRGGWIQTDSSGTVYAVCGDLNVGSELNQCVEGTWTAFPASEDWNEFGPVLSGMEMFQASCTNERVDALHASIIPITQLEVLVAVLCSLLIALFVFVICKFSRCRRQSKAHKEEYAAVEMVDSEAGSMLS